MPRRGRVVFPGVPHHVTQRGNHRERVFFVSGDPAAYLTLLHAYSRRYGLQVLAYCLMPNHIHLIVVPTNLDCMHRVLRAVHSQYAQRVNRMRRITGHLWQGRYGSSAMDVNHFLNAIRYVELNPVHAGLVARAEEFAWSSAAAHCGRRFDPVLEPAHRSSLLSGIANWSRWLAEGIPEDFPGHLQDCVRRNLPCGSEEFVAGLEKSARRDLQLKPRGGQRKK